MYGSTGRLPQLAPVSRLGRLGQELVVRPERLHAVHEPLEGGRRGPGVAREGVEGASHPPHLLQLLTAEEELLVAGGAGVDVDGRVDPALGEAAVSRLASMTAASPARPADMPNTDTRTSAVLIPDMRAASGLPPVT